MKIAIDISQVVYETGVSTYTKNLVENILRIDKANDYLLVAQVFRRKSHIARFLAGLDGKFESKTLFLPPTLAQILWNQLRILPFEATVGEFDLLHTSDWTEPPTAFPKVTTIHDVIPLKYPEYSHPRLVEVHRRKLALNRSESKYVIAPSNVTKNDLVDLGFEDTKVVVIPEAVDPIYEPKLTGELAVVKRKYNLTKPYIITVGATPRKNISRLVKAFLPFKKDFDLVVVGYNYGVAVDKSVKFLGHVPKSDMPSLYSGSQALAYPSLYEGFGLPILEAFACKVPVLTSNVGSMLEIAQDAAVLVDPLSHQDIAAGLKEVLSKADYYTKKGYNRSQNYSWQKTATRTLAVYKKANG